MKKIKIIIWNIWNINDIISKARQKILIGRPRIIVLENFNLKKMHLN